MQMKPFRFGPIALTNAIANLLNPATAAGGTNAGASAQYILLTALHIVNQTGADHTYELFVGATGASAAGTEVEGKDRTCKANDRRDIFFGGPGLRLDSADFLTGKADANTALTIYGEGQIGVAG